MSECDHLRIVMIPGISVTCGKCQEIITTIGDVAKAQEPKPATKPYAQLNEMIKAGLEIKIKYELQTLPRTYLAAYKPLGWEAGEWGKDLADVIEKVYARWIEGGRQ